MASKDRLSGIGERINVRLTLLEEALGMTPGDSEIYSKWIASKAPEPELGEEISLPCSARPMRSTSARHTASHSALMGRRGDGSSVLHEAGCV